MPFAANFYTGTKLVVTQSHFNIQHGHYRNGQYQWRSSTQIKDIGFKVKIADFKYDVMPSVTTDEVKGDHAVGFIERWLDAQPSLQNLVPQVVLVRASRFVVKGPLNSQKKDIIQK
jgi:hypothetical protein